MAARWIVAGLVALATLALFLTSATYSAPTATVDIGGNVFRAGTLRLDLSGGDAEAHLSFPGLMPGGRVTQRWLVANDPASPVAATASVTFDRLHDQGPGGRAGILSRLLSVELAVEAGPRCDPATATPVVLAVTGAGNLRALATGSGVELPLRSASGPLTLAPGASVCVAVSAFWVPGPEDNAAEGDTFDVRANVRLTQDFS